VYSLGPGVAAAAAGRGPGGRPLGAEGGTLHVFSTSGSLESRGACTPGPVVRPPGFGLCPQAVIAPNTPTTSIPVDFI